MMTNVGDNDNDNVNEKALVFVCCGSCLKAAISFLYVLSVRPSMNGMRSFESMSTTRITP